MDFKQILAYLTMDVLALVRANKQQQQEQKLAEKNVATIRFDHRKYLSHVSASKWKRLMRQYDFISILHLMKIF